MSDAHILVNRIMRASCASCFDTGIAVSEQSRVHECVPCIRAGRELSSSKSLFNCVFARIEKKQLIDLPVLNIARVLTHSKADAPISGPILSVHLRLSERKVKEAIKTLRDEWHLPVISRREDGGGYWYAESAAQFLEWFRTYRNQAINELVTAHGILRANYPELSGQGTLDFIKSFTDELQEALR